MNYRRGFQRIYALLTVGWVAALLFALPPYRLIFWEPPIDYDALAITAGATDDSYATRVRDTKAMAVPPPPGYVLDHSKAWYEAREKQTGWASTDDYSTSKQSPPGPLGPSRTGKFLWLTALLFGPPALGYFSLFYVGPWIYRGFRSA
jgi:hypothetical protein